MAEWEINKSLGQCCGTGREIEQGEEYFAALVETEVSLQRQDFCSDYWNEKKPKVFCYWKTKLPQPNQKKQLFVDDEMLIAFFDRLAKETEQEKINFRFVLMLILMRKRKLKYDSIKTENNKELWRLKIVNSDGFAEVENPHLNEEQIEQLSLQVGEILQVNLQQ